MVSDLVRVADKIISLNTVKAAEYVGGREGTWYVVYTTDGKLWFRPNEAVAAEKDLWAAITAAQQAAIEKDKESNNNA